MNDVNQRLFLGFSLEKQQQQALGVLQQTCLNACIGARMVKASNLHMTLVFLGQTPATIKQPLLQQVPQLPLRRFTVMLDKLALWSKPQILCLTGEADEPLLTLANAAANLSEQLGLAPKEHSYRPHITLLRKAKHLPQSLPPTALQLTPTTLNLYHSLSSTSGVEYRVLQRWPLP
ncbi:RNA 2',3'-cyclic phosphodiesterase [Shewanella dokdonensis]|uniref:RNA 2',3'-cyclic phosphodiesterase n=1 Tax=Shewanella dokdonensis TaxID=712036 RepID=A0ABX8DGY1_9GAMM|nr:RNA 2',3'-cyclic phosphodiesterase [Shewanella dokdonensis]MCL1074294.1 RNA 2',3'-cyclic phosphodiesterase [Shewanella dokdonensis]QVK23996.1 RNA 2',3'-cyclic phosphodiesterase [Shewanella dokdonensis]